MTARIVIVSGACGTGKTTIARLLAKNSTYDYAVHIHTDDFYQYIRKGYISPWLDGSGDQNETVIDAVVASTKSFSEGGYEVYVDGVIGPWFLEQWIKLAEEGFDIRYIVLRPDEETTISRAFERTQRDYFPLNHDDIKNVWNSLSDLGKYESNVVDTTTQTIDESMAYIQKMLQRNAFRIL